MTKVFVYGSLKEGYGNHRLLSTSEKVAEYVTPPIYTLHDLGAFPAVTLKGDTPITGEIYEVNDEVFKRLDMLEGYPHFYDRVEIDTPHGDAWMYYLKVCNDRNIPEGVW